MGNGRPGQRILTVRARPRRRRSDPKPGLGHPGRHALPLQILEVAVRVDGGLTAHAARGDGLLVVEVDHVTRTEEAGDARRRLSAAVAAGGL